MVDCRKRGRLQMTQSYPPKLAVRGASGLSARGMEVLTLLARGFSMKEAALKLGIPLRTVAYEKYRIMNASQLETSSDLIRFAIRLGVLPNFDAKIH